MAAGLVNFAQWVFEGSSYIAGSGTSITVTVDDENPERTLIAYYYDDSDAMTPTPIPPSN